MYTIVTGICSQKRGLHTPATAYMHNIASSELYCLSAVMPYDVGTVGDMRCSMTPDPQAAGLSWGEASRDFWCSMTEATNTRIIFELTSTTSSLRKMVPSTRSTTLSGRPPSPCAVQQQAGTMQELCSQTATLHATLSTK